MQWQFICRYDTDTAQEPGSLFWCHAMMSLQFAHVRSFACRGRLQNLLADCSTIGLYCVKITRQINLQTFTSVSVVGVFRMWPELLLLTARGVTRGSRGHNFPGAESLCGRRKSQQCHKYFLQYRTFASERLRFEHGRVKLASCPGRHLSSLRRCLLRFFFHPNLLILVDLDV